MSTFLTRLYCRRKGLLMAVAAFPMFQATGTCDPFALNSFFGQQIANTVFGLFVSSVQQVLFQNFPGSDVIQTFLGGNPYPIIN